MKTCLFAMSYVISSASVLARSGLEVQFNIRVIDEQRVSIPNAQINMGFIRLVDDKDSWKGQEHFNVGGLSDRSGRWSVAGTTLSRPSISAKKEGYYSSSIIYTLIERDMTLSQWKPYERNETLILRKIVNPIPMYAWGMHLTEYPVGTNVWVGYDMLLAEWMPPHGKGKTEDVRFHVLRSADAYDRTQPAVALTVRFMGEKNGVCAIDDKAVNYQSWLKLPYCAPREGYSEKEFRFEKRFGENEFKTMTNTGTTNCFFRIRSKADRDGNFVEGLYGKINGPVGVEGGRGIRIELFYYVNPTPNDLNMEFNPKKNLINKEGVSMAVPMP